MRFIGMSAGEIGAKIRARFDSCLPWSQSD
jgi:hypothetical protein